MQLDFVKLFIVVQDRDININSNNPIRREEQIHNYIRNNQVGNAVERTLDYCQDFHSDRNQIYEANIISCEFLSLLEEKRRQIIERDAFIRDKKKLCYQILELIEIVKEGFIRRNQNAA